MNIAVIASGGKGKRFNNSLPKQYIKVNGKEIIAYTLDVFQNCEKIDDIYIAAQNEYFELLYRMKEKFGFTKLKKVLEGGNHRQDSVHNVLKAIIAQPNDKIIVHDAARPLIPDNVLNKALLEAEFFDNIVVCIKAKDTLLKGDEFVSSHVDRENLYYVQTPQIFSYRILMDAMQKAQNENFYGTDESIIVKRAGYEIKISEGSVLNFKITLPEDLVLFKKLISR